MVPLSAIAPMRPAGMGAPTRAIYNALADAGLTVPMPFGPTSTVPVAMAASRSRR
jgi:hypothetical protein